MFIKILNEERQEVYINLNYVNHIYKGHLCNNQPAIFFSIIEKEMYYWIFQTEKERDESFDNIEKPKISFF